MSLSASESLVALEFRKEKLSRQRDKYEKLIVDLNHEIADLQRRIDLLHLLETK